MRKSRSPRKLAPGELFEYAVRSLAVRACTAAELAFKLRGRAANIADVDGTVLRLREIGYLNDERFAESFAGARVVNQGFGKSRVLSDLRARRVPPKLAEQAVEQALEGRVEAEMVDAYIARRMPSLAAGGKIEDQKKLASAWRRLRRAGFSPGASMAALKKLAARPEELEEPEEEEADAESVEGKS